MAAVALVDPYNLFRGAVESKNLTLSDTFLKIDPCLWKCFDYQRNPVRNIILGDSRADNLDTKYIQDTTNEKYYNLAYGGGTLPEIIDTFWFATKQIKLQKVYIGLNFNLYNQYNTMNRFVDVDKIMNCNSMYFINHNVVKSLYYYLRWRCSANDIQVGRPDKDKNQFWQSQLGAQTRSFYANYKYPDNYLSELKKIASYCTHNDIKLVFIIFPTHIDLQNKVREYNLVEEEKHFKNDVMALAPTYDFDYANYYTMNRDNFKDPYHYENSHSIINEIWLNKIKYARSLIHN